VKRLTKGKHYIYSPLRFYTITSKMAFIVCCKFTAAIVSYLIIEIDEVLRFPFQ